VINRAIIIIKIFQKIVGSCEDVADVLPFQIIVLDKVREDIPETLYYVQIVNQNVVEGVAETGVDEFFGGQHLLNDHVANHVEDVVGDVFQFAERVQLFDIQHVLHVDGLDESTRLFAGVGFFAVVGNAIDELFLDRGLF
jgi:hypothetical protein